MAQIVDINEYRSIKQKQFFVRLYQFFNENLDYQLDHTLVDFDEAFIELCQRYRMDAAHVDFFRIPIITFITTVLIYNSDLKDFFPQSVQLQNVENRLLFKNTLIEILKTLEPEYCGENKAKYFEAEMEITIERGFENLLRIIPQKIEFI
ncbi:hypothetical protein Amet_3136 [Alkaliphilus metalliredigens QYMF]|uniref:Uncharacterized protein n=1 Tax=Alkaliphilus metalliredigens (strain QYMF) TaxID=293826 RepID=A6TSV7_ALKMQ|nr:hypothetical protein [Alkaliphilus metalliredigens]ABR49275.1 hypothetical protein Amet_3136 [Alkaliphilus metalliredigens QYMF]